MERVALVTGARVVVADVAVTEAEETAHLIETAGGKAVVMRADVACSADVARSGKRKGVWGV